MGSHISNISIEKKEFTIQAEHSPERYKTVRQEEGTKSNKMKEGTVSKRE